jgi:hypothetical protein
MLNGRNLIDQGEFVVGLPSSLPDDEKESMVYYE